MAINSTPRRRYGVALGVVLTTVTAGMIGFVGTAAAHTNRSHAECEGDTTTLTVDLTAYNPEKTNTVKITDGDKVLDENTNFGGKYQEVFEVPGDVKHVFTIDVKAGDDPKGHEGWSFTKEYTVEACVEQTTTPPTETTTTTTPPVETTTESPVPTSSEAPPAPTTPPTTTTTEQEEVLAETGASVALPLGIAGVLIVGGVGAMFFVRRRSKA